MCSIMETGFQRILNYFKNRNQIIRKNEREREDVSLEERPLENIY